MTQSLVKLAEATRMLAEIRTVDDAKKLVNLAEAARYYAKEVGLGLKAQNNATEIKLRGQRRGGEVLRKIEKAKAGRPPKNRLQPVTDLEEKLLTYAEMDITKRDAHNWQAIADMPKEDFEIHIEETKAKDKELSTTQTVRLAKKLAKEKEKEQHVEKSLESLPPRITDRYRLIHGDMQDILPTIENESVDAIITDPPYSRKFLPLYEILAREAARVLKPGGSLLAMAGQSYLPTIFKLMTPHIRYQWTVAYLTPGGQAPQIWHRKVNAFWKPVLWFVNESYDGHWHGDVVKSDVNDNDKRFHVWGQSESGMIQLVEGYSLEGQRVLDPFMGGGTVGVLSLKLNRQFVGIDNDEAAIQTTLERFKEEGLL